MNMPHTFTVTLGADAIFVSHTAYKTHNFGIYFIKCDEEIVRVGESQSSYTRIIKGFKNPFRKFIRGKDRKHYMAYPWRTYYPHAILSVDFFELKDPYFKDNSLRRSLEAELTFQLRLYYKKWPIRMCEIHFSEATRTDTLIVTTASEILAHYKIPYAKEV